MRHKFLAVILALLICCIGGKAYADGDTGVIWGIKASANVELPDKWRGELADVTMYNPGGGFSVGAVSNIYLGKNFYFEPSVALFYSNYKIKDLIIMGENGLPAESDPPVYKWGIQVPVVFGYSLDISGRFAMNVFTGPQIRYAFAGKIDINDESLVEDMASDLDLWCATGQRRFDCSWKIGLGFPVSSFNISVEADFGLTDLHKGDMSFRENRFCIGLTYFL